MRTLIATVMSGALLIGAAATPASAGPGSTGPDHPQRLPGVGPLHDGSAGPAPDSIEVPPRPGQSPKAYRHRPVPAGTHLDTPDDDPTPIDFGDRLVPAWRAGRISTDTLVRLGALSVLDPSAVPDRWQPERPLGDLAPSYLEVLAALLPRTSAQTQEWFGALFDETTRAATGQVVGGGGRVARSSFVATGPAAECMTTTTVLLHDFACTHTSTHFTVRYNVAAALPGGGTGPGLQPTDADANDLPDTLDALVQGLESAYSTYAAMGYTPPAATAGGVQVLVGVDDNDNPGMTVPSLGSGQPALVVLPSDPDASGAAGANYLGRHEAFNVFLDSYVDGVRVVPCEVSLLCTVDDLASITWWRDATAEWAVHQSYLADPAAAALHPQQRDRYARSIGAFLGDPGKALNRWDGVHGRVQSGAFVLAQFLAEYTGSETAIRQTWELLGDGLPLTAIDQVLANYGLDPDLAYAVFAQRNYLPDNGYTDPDAATVWRDALGLESPGQSSTAPDAFGPARPARQHRTLTLTSPTTSGTVTLQPGGTAYIDLDVSGPVRSRLSADVTSVGTVRSWLVAWGLDGYPSVQQVAGPGAGGVGGGVGQLVEVVLPPGTTGATLVLARVDRVARTEDAMTDDAVSSWQVGLTDLSAGGYGWGWDDPWTMPNADPDFWGQRLVTPRALDAIPGRITRISATGGFGHALLDEGTVWAWGGAGASPAPRPITGLTGVVQLAGGPECALALTSGGTVYTLGGWSCTGTAEDWAGTPVAVQGLPPIARLASYNGRRVYAITADGEVWAWGWNGSASIGTGCLGGAGTPTGTWQATPVHLSMIHDVRDIAVDYDQGPVAVKTDGTVWWWGRSLDPGQRPAGAECTLNPVQVAGLSDIESVATGNSSLAFAVDGDGQVWAWGRYGRGLFGGSFADLDESLSPPRAVPGLTGVTKVVYDQSTVLALTTTGHVRGYALDWRDSGSGEEYDYPYLPDGPPLTEVAGLHGVTDIAISAWDTAYAVVG